MLIAIAVIANMSCQISPMQSCQSCMKYESPVPVGGEWQDYDNISLHETCDLIKLSNQQLQPSVEDSFNCNSAHCKQQRYDQDAHSRPYSCEELWTEEQWSYYFQWYEYYNGTSAATFFVPATAGSAASRAIGRDDVSATSGMLVPKQEVQCGFA